MRRRELILLLGGALTAARALGAQQKAMPVIGFLGSALPSRNASLVAAFHQGLSETGYVEGQNVAIEYRWAEGHYERLPALAADLVGLKVDVIATPYPECTESEIDAAFATLIQLQAGAVVVGPGTFFTSRRDQLVALASRHAIPAIYYPREFVEAGGLISYGPSLTDAYRRAGI